MVGVDQGEEEEPSASFLLTLLGGYRRVHPRWKLVETVPPPCTTQTAFPLCGVLTGMEAGNWTVTSEGAQLHSDPFHCCLRRFSRSQALQCLSFQSLLLVGDSLFRYQSSPTFFSQESMA